MAARRAPRSARAAAAAPGLAKSRFDRGLDGPLADGLAIEHEAFTEAARTEDVARGITRGAGPGQATFVGR